MDITVYNIVLTILTSGVLGIFGVAWQTYNKFVLMLVKVEFIIEQLKQSDEKHKEIFNRLREIENRLTKVEK